LYKKANGQALTVKDHVVKTFLCPSDPSLDSNSQRYGYASTSYAGNLKIFDPKGPRSLLAAMPDGTSNTVMIAERYKACAPNWGGTTQPAWAMHPTVPLDDKLYDAPVFGWQEYGLEYAPNYKQGNLAFQTAPQVASCDWHVTQSGHTGGMEVGLGDGSVRAVAGSISMTTWANACDPRDGNPLGSDW